MKTIPLTKGYVALVDDDDYDRVMQFSWYASPRYRRDGTLKAVYAQRGIYKPKYKQKIEGLHRFVMDVGESRVDVDHVNRDGLDCRRENLRIATRSQNNANGRRPMHNTSGYRGVSFSRRANKWVAQVGAREGMTYLGLFLTPEAAAREYDRKARELWGEFAYANFPDDMLAKLPKAEAR